MSDSLTELLATDAELDMIAARQNDGPRDLVLAELAMLAAALDDVPLPPVVLPVSRPAMSSVRKGGWALSVTVALMVTSSGVAAAVSEDPLAPLHYVTTHVWKMGPHNRGQMPGWALDGSMPISTVPGVGLHPTAVSPTGVASSGNPRYGQTGSGAVGSAGPGSSTGGTGGPGGPGLSPGQGGHRPSIGTGTGRGGNSGTQPPNGGVGQGPGNATLSPGSGSGNPGDPGNPSTPGEPVRPGHLNEHASLPNHEGFGQVPQSSAGGGTGVAHHCRIDHPVIHGDSWSGAPGLRPCPTHPSAPDQPAVPKPKAQPPGSSAAPSPAPPTSSEPATPGSPKPVAPGKPGAPTPGTTPSSQPAASAAGR